MNDDTIKKYCERLTHMRSDRSSFEEQWEDIAVRMWPAMVGSFHGAKNTQGQKNTSQQYDSTAALALNRFSAVLQSMLNPSNQRWHGLRPMNEELMKDRDTAIWFDEATRILFNRRYVPKSNFSTATRKVYKSEGAFGNGGMFVDLQKGYMRYQTFPLSRMFITEDIFGNPQTMFRTFDWSIQKIVDRFTQERVPEKWLEELKRNPQAEKEILHVCTPRTDVDADRIDYKGMAYASLYIAVELAELLEEGGYNTFPYVFSRYDQSAGEVYGRSPAMTALADIKMINAMSKSVIRATHRQAEPPVLAHDDGVLGRGRSRIDLRPNAVNYGAVDENGRPLIHAFNPNGRVELAEGLTNDRRNAVKEAFLITLFQILVDTPEMSATEAMIRAQEKGMLITPEIETQRSQLHAPLIEREIDLLMRHNLFPEMTPAMLEAGVEDYEITYSSPFDRLQDSEEVVGIQRTFEVILPLAQYDPNVLRPFDYEAIARRTAQINGVPAEFIKSAERIAQDEADEAQAQQAAQMGQVAGDAAGAMKDIASAQKLASEAGALG